MKLKSKVRSTDLLLFIFIQKSFLDFVLVLVQNFNKIAKFDI